MVFIKIYAFIVASFIGSFLNVVIHRMPRGESVVTPRSKCPRCGYMIPWYLNIPVFSYLYLRGKCKNCSAKISIRYPLVELFTGLVGFMLFPKELTSETLVFYVYEFFIACIFIAHFVIDLDHKLLLDKLNIFLLVVVLSMVIVNYHWSYWVFGGLVGFLLPYGITWIFYKLRGVIGLGGGDIKLFGILGLLFGIQGVLHNIFFSCFLGALIGSLLIMFKKMNRTTAMPFGPFILITAALQFYFPQLFDQINLFNI